jgi:hypothetical protein
MTNGNFQEQAAAAQQPLSGQQIQAMANDYAAKLAAIKRDIELRKFAVNSMVELMKTAYGPAIGPAQFNQMLVDLHAFLVEAGEKAE